MNTALWYAIFSTTLVSFISLIGIITLSLKKDFIIKATTLFISLSAGALLGNVFLYLLPEFIINQGNGSLPLSASLIIISGFVLFFILEKFIIWHHCHGIETFEDHNKGHHSHNHSIGPMNLIGDGLHNFIDGLIIGASFLVSIPIGIATTTAVIIHEIPQEIGDFGVLIHSGYSVKKALIFNFISATLAILGAIMAVFIGKQSETFLDFIIPLVIGAFIYIVGSDLIPELKKENTLKQSLLQIAMILIGIGIMFALL